MQIKIVKTGLEEVQPFRVLFLHENNFQFVHDKCHLYGWADTYLFQVDGTKVGYGSVWGQSKREDRDAIFEFYIIKPFRKFSNFIFPEFLSVSGITCIECQTNDRQLISMLYEYSQNINAEAILFDDHYLTSLSVPGVTFTKKPVENNNPSDVSGFVLEQDGEVVATGGFMLNYNMPYADIYMGVKENYRQKGFGSLIIQELKKEIYLMGRVPSARCNIRNQLSKATLIKAGFKVCGFIVKGEVRKGEN